MAFTTSGTPGTKWVGTRVVAPHPSVHRTAPTENDLAPNVHSAKVKSYPRLVILRQWASEGAEGVNPQEITCTVLCACPLLWDEERVFWTLGSGISPPRFKTADVHLSWVPLAGGAPISLSLSFLFCTMGVRLNKL